MSPLSLRGAARETGLVLDRSQSSDRDGTPTGWRLQPAFFAYFLCGGVTIQQQSEAKRTNPAKLRGQRVDQRTVLFAQGGQVGADRAERLHARFRAEAPRDFLFEFGHADIAFGLVVVERHTMICNETPHLDAHAGEAVASRLYVKLCLTLPRSSLRVGSRACCGLSLRAWAISVRLRRA